MIRLALVALLLAFAAPVSAKVICVDPVSGSDATSYASVGSSSSCWATLPRAFRGNANINSGSAVEAPVAGDTVLILQGTYAVNQDSTNYSPNRFDVLLNPINQGTSGNRITYRCVASFAGGASEPAVPSGCTVTTTLHDGPLIGVNTRNYITVAGFRCVEATARVVSDTGCVVMYGATGVELLDGTVVGSTTAFGDNHNGIRSEQTIDGRISNWHISGIRDSVSNTNATGITTYYSTNLTIEYVTVTDTGRGLYLKGANDGPLIVRFNHIHTSLGHGIFIGGVYNPGGTGGARIYGNLVSGASGGGISFRELSADGLHPRGVKVCNNTSIGGSGASGTAPLEFGAAGMGQFLDNYVVGNIFKDGQRSIMAEDQITAQFASGVGPDPSNLVIEHNVYHGATNLGRVEYTNYTFAGWKTLTGSDVASPVSVESDPLFVDTTTYLLQSGSPARMAVPDRCDIDSDGNTTETVDAGARQFADNGAPVQIGYSSSAALAASGGTARIRFKLL